MNVVQQWFGPGFALLDPLLQQLHTQGGVLQGEVAIVTGRGWAGFVGRRLAARLGIPLQASSALLRVEIHAQDKQLYWGRCFNGQSLMVSVFEPVGSWPTGYWLERTGPISVALAVDIREGGWYWRPLKAWWRGIRIPLQLMPRIEAYKRIDRGQYYFYVGFSMPWLGTVLSYSGALIAQTKSGLKPQSSPA